MKGWDESQFPRPQPSDKAGVREFIQNCFVDQMYLFLILSLFLVGLRVERNLRRISMMMKKMISLLRRVRRLVNLMMMMTTLLLRRVRKLVSLMMMMKMTLLLESLLRKLASLMMMMKMTLLLRRVRSL